MNEELAEFGESLKLADLDILIEEHVRSGEYKTAVFWAEKRLALFAAKPIVQRLPEIAHYLNILTVAGSWQMISSYCSRYDLHLKHIVFTYYFVNAMFNMGNYFELVSLPMGTLSHNKDLPSMNMDEMMESRDDNPTAMEAFQQLDLLVRERKIEARLMLIMAKAYLLMQNRPAAKSCIRECLLGNPYSSEALQTAIDSKLLNDKEIKKLLSNSNTKGRKSTGSKVMTLLYELRCSKSEPSDRSVYNSLIKDVSVQAAMASKLYNKGNISEAFGITSSILGEYGYYENCMLVHIACLVSLRKHNALFALSHHLVDTMPQNHITWYSVGCYYYTVEQFATAKKFLEKATTLNAGFGEGWIAYGHVLFYSEEHEQAMNCFLRASRVLEGNFEPLLYIAMEHSFASNFKLSLEFMKDADNVEPGNPIVQHEEATVAYLQNDLNRAESIYRRAIRQVCKAAPRDNFSTTLSRPCSDFWEPMFENMGHTLLRLSRYDEAIDVFRKALSLGRNKAEAWVGIGICMGCLGRVNDGIEALNEAILMRPNDELIERAVEMLMTQAARLPLDDIIEPTLAGEENEENMDFLAASTDHNVEPPEVQPGMDDEDAPSVKFQHTTPMRTRSQANANNSFCR